MTVDTRARRVLLVRESKAESQETDMKVIDRHPARDYDVAIVQYTGSQNYEVIRVMSGARITGQETVFERTRALAVARDSANLLWLRGMRRETRTYV